MSNIEFIDVAVDTHNMEHLFLNCSSALINTEAKDLLMTYSNENHTLEITGYTDDSSKKNTFNDVNLKYFKEEPDNIGVIFSHVSHDQFTQFRSLLPNPGIFTITGIEKDNEHISLVNIDYSQFTSCS